jgi:phenylalanyl-tRNA synthetase beta chain
MQFPESWLREFCNPVLTTRQLADVLTMAGLEVEELRPVAPAFSRIVVAEIVEAIQHPNADKLRVCKVRAGEHSAGGDLQIVCGAPNARVGIRVPLALVGAELPPGEDGKPFKIGIGKLRGIESFGMLCSARELKLSEDHGGLLELDPQAPVGADIRAVLNLDDTLFTLKLTPNLGHALSIYGIAREVSALTGAPLKSLSFPKAQITSSELLPVSILAPDLCGRFTGRVIRNVNTQVSTPSWILERLARCGQRAVSPLVDISNYVMFEYGRPSHIFDLEKINGQLMVRWGSAGESLELLNGNTITVDEQVGVIADAQSVESLAGIMGGQATAVSDSTRHIYVEAAFWWPEAVAGRSRRFNFSTDAGHRFERGVDPASTVEHIEHITALIQQVCGGDAGPIDDHTPNVPARPPVSLRVARAAKVLGMPITQAQCEQVFVRLGLPFTHSVGTVTVSPPSYRFDLLIEEDLIEEVIRVIGLQNLPDTPPTAPIAARPVKEAVRTAHGVRHALAALGYQETINFSFVEERLEAELAGNANPIKVLNPIASPLSVMRSSLLGSLIEVLKTNLTRRATQVRVFELGRVFARDENVSESLTTVAGIAQPMKVAGLAWGPANAIQWGLNDRSVDFFDVKGDVQALMGVNDLTFRRAQHPAMHPGRCAEILAGDLLVGVVGELHPQWRQAHGLPSAPVLFELNLEAVLKQPIPVFTPLPRQQASLRDVALIIDRQQPAQNLLDAMCADPEGLVQSALLFDIYVPPAGTPGFTMNEHSLAIRLEIADDSMTMTDDRIEAAKLAAVARASAACGARLRA